MSCNMFLFLLLVSCVCSVLLMNFSKNDQKFGFESEKLKLIRSYLKKINKPSEKTIYSPDGDLIDCVAYNQQPAFDHPLLQEYKSLSQDHPEMAKQKLDSSSSTNDNPEEIIQVWHTSGESCPKHTIPIRRITEEYVLKASSTATFGVFKNVNRFGMSERASGYVEGNFSGVHAVINVWVPLIDKEKDVSSSRVLIKAGRMDDSGTSLSSFEVGYKVVHGDPNPRLFVYWSDSFQEPGDHDPSREDGCYDLSCSGFIQTSNKIALGGAITPVSKTDNQQKEFNIRIQKVVGGDWWLTVQGEPIGYWPSAIVRLLDGKQDCTVEYGGEVLSPVELNRSMPMPHTKTEMGSGSFPIINDDGANYKKVAFIRNITLYFYNISETQPQLQEHTLWWNNPDCYNVQKWVSDNWGVHLFFGGRGGNATNCTAQQY